MRQNRLGRPFGKRPLNLLRRLALWGACLVLGVIAFALRPGFAMEDTSPFVLDSDDNGAHYMLTISGTVGTESFQGVRAQLEVSAPEPGSTNPYQLVVVGFPESNTRNSFYWNTEDGPMDVVAGRMRSRITGRGIKLGNIHFFYLSPVLFAHNGARTHTEDERDKYVEQTALPTKIFAQDGELTLTLGQDRISGRVVMTGLDPIGHTYVRYTATFAGQRIRGLPIKR